MFKLAITSLLVAATLAGLPKPDFGFLSDEEIHYINNVAKTTWTAGRNFHPDDHAYVKSMIGFPGSLKSKDLRGRLPRKEFPDTISVEDLPKSFDAREAWPNCPSVNEIKDQGNCANAWAVASVATLTDRFCILSRGKIKVQLSAQDLWECCTDCGTGCETGDVTDGWEYFLHKGIVSGGSYNSSQGCRPYKFQPCEHNGISGDRPPCNQTKQPAQQCSRECREGYPTAYDDDLRYAKTAHYVGKEWAIMQELQLNGPVTADMWLYTDFLHYKSGIYQHVSGKQVGHQSVKIIGYGEEKGVKYWLVANSWNTDWGDKGFFKILRGRYECSIETYGFAGLPDL